MLMSKPHSNPHVRDSVSCYLEAPSETTDLDCSISGVTSFVIGTYLINTRVHSIYILKNITMNMASIFPHLTQRIKPYVSS